MNPNDQQPWQTPIELQATESRLRLLAPRADRMDRERLIFLAGKASVEVVQLPTARWAWPASLAAMTALAATLLVMLLNVPKISPLESASPKKSLTELRQDFAQQLPKPQKPRGITTATIYREKELENLLNGESTFAANRGTQDSHSTEPYRQQPILTPSSWEKLLDESISIY